MAKVGGAQLEVPAQRRRMAAAIAAARAAGHELIVVHGGGNQIRELTRRLGLVEQQHEGLRVTDPETAEVVLMVLAGLVNKQLVRDLNRCGLRAAGLCGADGQSFSARKHSPGGVDIGYVGEVAQADATLANVLLHEGFVPVIATSAPLAHDELGPDERFYNVNADLGAGPIARALKADALLLLTDVPGVLDAQGALLPLLSRARCDQLRRDNVIRGGMLPKVAAALAALEHSPGMLVKIAPAAAQDCVLAALAEGAGTRFIEETQ